MGISKKLESFLKDNNLSIAKNKIDKSLVIFIKIPKDRIVLFKLWHNDNLFSKQRKWSINFYKDNQLTKTKLDVGGIGKAIKDMAKKMPVLSQNEALSS